MSGAGKTIKQRLRSLEEHLHKENPVLVASVQSYRQLDQVGRSLGLLNSEQSFATHISWWPMISVLGTFSAGKSTFINHYLGDAIQSTGNQAVDDKFTVICYGSRRHAQALPGTALDADPRFPFYQISEELEKVARGEGRRVDTYLQLKTVPSEKLSGRIIIDSPGFDADSQRDATLRLTDHIIDLSDLVLVFFDARHPEPGAMRDTLKHLVGQTIHRADATKFMFILNQMDTTARDDNPEEVVGAWQRALAQEGLTAGRFYCIYNPDAAVAIPDASRRTRYEAKRDHDLAEIHQRIQGVSVERAYRITGTLERLAHYIEEKLVPWITEYRAHWRKAVIWGDAAIAIGVLTLLALANHFLLPGGPDALQGSRWQLAIYLGMVFIGTALFGWLHFRLRAFAAARIIRNIERTHAAGLETDRLKSAFLHNTRPWISIFLHHPVGWNRSGRNRLHRVIAEANRYVQILNDRFTNPSGLDAAGESASGSTLKSVDGARNGQADASAEIH
jgi:Dynamin family